jgi:hypothetical protein
VIPEITLAKILPKSCQNLAKILPNHGQSLRIAKGGTFDSHQDLVAATADCGNHENLTKRRLSAADGLYLQPFF